MNKINHQEKITKLVELMKFSGKTDEMKVEIASVLGDLPLEEKMRIADEVMKVAKPMSAPEKRNLQFIVPHVMKEFYDLPEAEQIRLDNLLKGITTPTTDTTTPTTDTTTPTTDTTTPTTDTPEVTGEQDERTKALNEKVKGIGTIVKPDMKLSDDLKGKKLDYNHPNGDININGDELSKVLYTVNGANLFSGMNWRYFVIAKVGENSYLPFYMSSYGTSGKTAGKWYPFFGYTGDRVIKGGHEEMEKGYNVPAVKATQDILNNNLKFPQDDVDGTGKILDDKNEIGDLNTIFKYKNCTNDQVKKVTGYMPTTIKHPNDTEKDDDTSSRWIRAILEDIKDHEKVAPVVEQTEPVVEQTEPVVEDIPMPVTKEENESLSAEEAEKQKFEKEIDEAILKGEYIYHKTGEGKMLSLEDGDNLNRILDALSDKGYLAGAFEIAEDGKEINIPIVKKIQKSDAPTEVEDIEDAVIIEEETKPVVEETKEKSEAEKQKEQEDAFALLKEMKEKTDKLNQRLDDISKEKQDLENKLKDDKDNK